MKKPNINTAKNGYEEEKLVVKNLNNNEKIKESLNFNNNRFRRVTGNNKTDIISYDKNIKIQIKKYSKRQFQHLDRHWLDDFIKSIPQLKPVRKMFKDLFEYPLLEGGKYIDKSIKIKKLCISNYSQEELNNFLVLLNNHKKLILNYAFLGNNLEMSPEYLLGVEYINKIRDNIKVFKIKKIIDYLENMNFKISPKKTRIILGNEKYKDIISLQRKGGDTGKKTSNQLQFKITISNLKNIEYKEYML